MFNVPRGTFISKQDSDNDFQPHAASGMTLRPGFTPASSFRITAMPREARPLGLARVGGQGPASGGVGGGGARGNSAREDCKSPRAHFSFRDSSVPQQRASSAPP